MKIAFIALPHPEDQQRKRIMPPLPLSYVAALLEQQRHIVRVYDLALHSTLPLTQVLAPMQSFRPHLVILASPNDAAAAAVDAYVPASATVMRLGTTLREISPCQSVARALWRMDRNTQAQDEQRVIFEAMLALNDELDALPFPARHLLSLEQYPLFTLNGELQTTVLLVQCLSAAELMLRQPALVLAELQNIAREHGIRHFVFPYCPIAGHQQWLHELLDHLASAYIDLAWEAAVSYEHLSPTLLRDFRRAGCETLCFYFTASDVLESGEVRRSLIECIEQVHDAGIRVRANIELEPLFGAVPLVVDLSATLGLDDVEFSVRRAASTSPEISMDECVTLEDVAEMARSRYRSSRSRQFFVERFGPQIGPMLWRVGRAGLLGRTWWRYATGGEDNALALEV